MNAPNNMAQIEQLALEYAGKRIDLNEAVQKLQTAIAAAYANHLPEIKTAIANVKDCHETINATIASNKPLFEKPRTVVFHGIKVGLGKLPGGMDWEDDDDVIVARIKKMFKDDETMLATLIITKEKPSKEGLEDLELAQLKRLGIEVVSTGDRVVIKPVDTVVDKTVRALLKGAVAAGAEEEA